LVRRLISGGLYLIILSPLLILILERIPWRGKEFLAGGLFGDLLLGFLTRYLNHTGSFFVLLCLLALALLFTTRWTLSGTLIFSRGFFTQRPNGENKSNSVRSNQKKKKK
jgi:hypothetical protein